MAEPIKYIYMYKRPYYTKNDNVKPVEVITNSRVLSEVYINNKNIENEDDRTGLPLPRNVCVNCKHNNFMATPRLVNHCKFLNKLSWEESTTGSTFTDTNVWACDNNIKVIVN